MRVAFWIKVGQRGAMGTPSFHLYLDDSGSRFPDHNPPEQRRDGMDHFALGGLLIESERLDEVIVRYDRLVSDYGISDPLHSHKIRTKKDGFRWLGKDSVKAESFYKDLTQFLCDLPCHVIACCIDRPCYNARYAERYGKDRWMLCKSAYTIVVERAAKFAMKQGRKLVVYIEHTGKRENRDICRYHDDLRHQGMYFDKARSECYAPLSGDDFAGTLMVNPKFVDKENKPIQIADLVLYPVVKGGYDPSYLPYVQLRQAGRLIDSVLQEDERRSMGIKYYCFDGNLSRPESKKAPETPKPLPAVCDDARSQLTIG